jgi:dUTP pyrophosphatase
MNGKAVASSSENNTYIQICKMTESALTTTQESPRSAGFNFLSPNNMTVPAKGKELIRTDLLLQIKLPEGCYGRIAPRKDLALFHPISIGAGVCDEDFCGNLSVLL